MKKLLIILSLLVWSDRVANPEEITTFVIFGTEPIKPFEKVWQAVCEVESNKNPRAYNKKEKATGIAQIRPIRLKDYNDRTDKNYKLEDCYNVEISKEIFLYYCDNPNNIEKICKSWNGSGWMTEIYWQKIKKALNS